MTVQQVLVQQLGALPVIQEYMDRLELKERVDALAPVRPVAHLTNGSPDRPAAAVRHPALG